MSLKTFMMGTPGSFKKIDKFDELCSGSMDQMLQSALPQLLSSLGNQGGFAPIAEQARSRFFGDTVPTLAERFSGLGSGGQRSSGFQESLASGAGQMNTDLAAMESQYGQQRNQQLMQMLGMGLTPQQEIGYFGQQPGFMHGMAPGIGEGLAKAGMNYLTGQNGGQGKEGESGGPGWFGSALGAGATGATMGGTIGGPIGAGVGAGGGALLSLLMSYLNRGKKGQQQPGSVSV